MLGHGGFIAEGTVWSRWDVKDHHDKVIRFMMLLERSHKRLSLPLPPEMPAGMMSLLCFSAEHQSSPMTFTSMISLCFLCDRPGDAHTQAVPGWENIAIKKKLGQRDKLDFK